MTMRSGILRSGGLLLFSMASFLATESRAACAPQEAQAVRAAALLVEEGGLARATIILSEQVPAIGLVLEATGLVAKQEAAAEFVGLAAKYGFKPSTGVFVETRLGAGLSTDAEAFALFQSRPVLATPGALSESLFLSKGKPVYFDWTLNEAPRTNWSMDVGSLTLLQTKPVLSTPRLLSESLALSKEKPASINWYRFRLPEAGETVPISEGIPTRPSSFIADLTTNSFDRPFGREPLQVPAIDLSADLTIDLPRVKPPSTIRPDLRGLIDPGSIANRRLAFGSVPIVSPNQVADSSFLKELSKTSKFCLKVDSDISMKSLAFDVQVKGVKTLAVVPRTPEAILSVHGGESMRAVLPGDQAQMRRAYDAWSGIQNGIVLDGSQAGHPQSQIILDTIRQAEKDGDLVVLFGHNNGVDSLRLADGGTLRVSEATVLATEKKVPLLVLTCDSARMEEVVDGVRTLDRLDYEDTARALKTVLDANAWQPRTMGGLVSALQDALVRLEKRQALKTRVLIVSGAVGAVSTPPIVQVVLKRTFDADEKGKPEE
jgi:hypothetical protein